MKTILVLQFRKKDTYVQNEVQAFRDAFKDISAHLIFKSAFDAGTDWNNPETILEHADGLILGGSGELDFDGGREAEDLVIHTSRTLAEQMQPFMSHIESHNIPTLGICFGHQLIAHTCGVPVLHDKTQAKAGSHLVILTTEGKNDPLFTDIPERFYAQYGHKDCISSLPPDAVLLGYGEQCSYTAVRHGKKRYSIQFHPELSATYMLERLTRHPEFLPAGMTPDMLVRDSVEATSILKNFLAHIA